MKKLIWALTIVIAISTVASAAVLQTANPLGAGKIGWLAAGQYDSNIGGNETLMGAGGYLAYGVMDKLDVFGKIGYGSYSNLPAYISSQTAMTLGVAGKYQLLAENATNMPVSVAALLGYQAGTATVNTVLGSGQVVQGDIGIGAVISKVIVPWVPYGALVYHSLANNSVLGSTTGTDLELVVGTQMLLSRTSAVVGEVSLNSTSSGGATTSDTQVSLGYSAKI